MTKDSELCNMIASREFHRRYHADIGKRGPSSGLVALVNKRLREGCTRLWDYSLDMVGLAQ